MGLFNAHPSFGSAATASHLTMSKKATKMKPGKLQRVWEMYYFSYDIKKHNITVCFTALCAVDMELTWTSKCKYRI